MTTEPYAYEDWSGDVLIVGGDAGGLFLRIDPAGEEGEGRRLDIPFADVREVTAAMHDKAGLPDRWELLRNWLGAGHEPWCADVLARMTELEAGR